MTVHESMEHISEMSTPTSAGLGTVAWQIVESYFRSSSGHQLVKHLIDSFDDFILRKLEQIVDGFNPIEIHNGYVPALGKYKHIVVVELRNPVLSKPMIHEKDGSTKIMTPNDARQRNFSYSAPLYIDIHITARTLNDDTQDYVTETRRFNNILLGKIPLMIRSKYCILSHTHIPDECPFDYGGYFIVNGNEKVVISQDRMAENRPYVFLNNKAGPYSHVIEVRSVGDLKFGVPKTTTLKLSTKPNQFGRFIRATVHHVKHDVPVFVLFKALGIVTDREIVRYIVPNMETDGAIVNELVGCIEDGSGVTSQAEALDYLMRFTNMNGHPRELLGNKEYRASVLLTILHKEFIPHVGLDFKKKALYLGYMVCKLLRCGMGLQALDDRDSYINKRIDTPGVLIAGLFRQYYGKVVKDIKNMIHKEINTGAWKHTGRLVNIVGRANLGKIIKSTIIEGGLKYGLATGNWGIKSNKTKQGVAQVLNRMTYNATLSHLRRINTPIEKSGKLVQPRKLHATQWGIICPAECFDPKTPILTWEGTIKEAKDIAVGDHLIDDVGNAVRVKSTCSGLKRMYEVIPDKDNFMRYTVTDNHILTLKVKKNNNVRNHRGKKELSWFDKEEMKYKYKDFDDDNELATFRSSLDDDDVIDITIEKYLSLPKGVQKNLYVFKSAGINWEEKAVALDPYILGMWLGDGLSSGYGFVTADMELLEKWIEWCAYNDATIKKGRGYRYSISSTINDAQPGINCNKTEPAPLKNLLAEYGLVKNKHIPLDYLVNDRKTRLAVLAGLVDTVGSVRDSGHEIRITQGEQNYRIIYDAEFLARSLGFSCHMHDRVCTYTVNGEMRRRLYKELSITGVKLYEIPTVLPMKKLNMFYDTDTEQRCNGFSQSSFKLVEKDVQPFVGWQLEGNGRFLLGDMSIVHNTPEGASVGLVKNLAIMATITLAANSAGVRDAIASHPCMCVFNGDPSIFSGPSRTLVTVNGDIMGVTKDPHELYASLKALKRTGTIHPYTSVVWNQTASEIAVCTEAGRCTRPLFIVSNGRVKVPHKAKYSWTDILTTDEPFIEFIDTDEANASLIAMDHKDLQQRASHSAFTHMELDPSLILGVLAGSIPFSDHNQAPRNTYQCLWLEEPVLMADGTQKKIKEVAVGDEVVTFDPKTMLTSTTKVVHQYVRPTDKKIFQVTLEGGRTIRATHNHNFMTFDGWCPVEKFGVETLVGVYPAVKDLPHETGEGHLVLGGEGLIDELTRLGVNPSLLQKHRTFMDDNGILPLRSSSKALPTVARICGYALTGGSVSIYNQNHDGWTPQCSFNFGSMVSANDFIADVTALGFLPVKVVEGTRYVHGTAHHTFTARYDGPFASLLAALGLTLGKRTMTPRKPVPAWVMEGSPLVKREFVAGFQGGNGCRIRWNKMLTGFNFVCGETTQSTHPKYVKELTFFVNQVASLMREMQVEVVHVSQCASKQVDRVHVKLKISDECDNLISYMKNIGYRYDERKMMSSALVAEYLAYKKRITSPKLDPHQQIDAWIKRTRIQGHAIFLPIESNVEVPNCIISDITVESDNHSFMAGTGCFLSSNSAMGKQAIGVYACNFRKRYDTMAHVLCYPQKPLVTTKISNLVNINKMPCGVNTIVAIATYTGFNQEDSIIINRSALERGLFVSTYFRTFREINNKNHSTGEEEYFCCPDPNTTKHMKPNNYSKVGHDGFVPENTFVESGDVVIGKCMPQKIGGAIYNKDTSVVLKSNECGFIDRNACNNQYFTNVNGDGYTFGKIRLRHDRVPTIGDKFCLPGHAEALTARGWVRMDEIKLSDKVIQLLPDGHAEYVHPTRVLSFEHGGAMYHAQGEGVHIECTMEHKLVVSDHPGGSPMLLEAYKAVGAKGLSFIKTSRGIAGDPCMRLGLSAEDFAYVAAAYLHRAYCDTAMSVVEFIANCDDRLASIFAKRCPSRMTVHTVAPSTLVIRVAEPDVYDFFSRWQHDIRLINQDLLDIPASAARVFVERAIWPPPTPHSSVFFADLVQQVAINAGLACDVEHVCNRTANVVMRSGCGAQYSEEVRTGFRGCVYCIEVTSHVFYVRMNGCGMWTGNSSRHGQKGTMGMMYRQEDMPFTEHGIVPDLIINPHAIPSRMTIAQLMECIMGKSCVFNGQQGDATPFSSASVDDLMDRLQRCGFEKHGNQLMYNGRTGEQINTAIFIGPTYYQRLKHMTSDKVHSRAANGPVVLLTRQPAEGRARDGGLRLGEMEGDCLMAHGVQQFLKERFMECSDNYRMHVCKKCGMFATVNPEKNIYSCRSCKNNTSFSEVRVPYAFKLLLQEIQTMGIGAKFSVA